MDIWAGALTQKTGESRWDKPESLKDADESKAKVTEDSVESNAEAGRAVSSKTSALVSNKTGNHASGQNSGGNGKKEEEEEEKEEEVDDGETGGEGTDESSFYSDSETT